MLDMIIGAAMGACVCIFGMWCFIKGQRNGIDIFKGNLPEQIKTPTQVAQEGIQNISEKAEQKKAAKEDKSLSEQLDEMCKYKG